MKKILISTILFITLILVFAPLTFSQLNKMNVDTALAYYPLSVGNKWVFDEIATSTIPPIITIQRVWSLEIINDTLMPNNENYFLMKQAIYDNVPFLSLSFERIDSASLNVLKYDADFDTSNFEILFLDLSTDLFNTFYTPFCEALFAEFGMTSRFGQSFFYRTYYYTCGLFYPEYYFLKDLGLYKYNWYADFVQSSSTLRGCIVNGILYGDTTIVSVKEEISPPSRTQLFQNYPNPFNPSTKIKFTIPSVETHRDASLQVKLTVFDILGNEVATLVNEQKPAGTYEIEFDSEGMPSGVYFYQLKAAEYVNTKKMILLR